MRISREGVVGINSPKRKHSIVRDLLVHRVQRKQERGTNWDIIRLWEAGSKMNFRQIDFEDVSWFRIGSSRMLVSCL